jgi:hypothetical protein
MDVENNNRRISETFGCEPAKMVVGTPAGLGSDVCHVTQQTVIPVGPANVLKFLQLCRVGTVPYLVRKCKQFRRDTSHKYIFRANIFEPVMWRWILVFSPFVLNARIDSPVWVPVSSASRPHTTHSGSHTLGPPGGKTTSSSAALYTIHRTRVNACAQYTECAFSRAKEYCMHV